MAFPSNTSLLRRQTGYQNKMFYRTPVAAFFTGVFPLMLLILFGALFGNEEIEEFSIHVGIGDASIPNTDDIKFNVEHI